MPRSKQFCEKEVLEKAVHLFWKKGFHNTSMQELVEHLGINRASIYHTYGDKRQLFLKAFKNYQEESTRDLKNFLEGYEDPRLGIKVLLDSRISGNMQDSERKGCFVVNTTTELIPGDPEIENILRTNRRNIENTLHNYLKAGEKKGLIKPGKDLRAIASLLFIVSNGLQVVTKVKGGEDTLYDGANAILALLD